MFALESFRQGIQDHVRSIVSGHILWFQSVAGIPSWACQPAQNTWPLQLSWSACEQKPQLHLLTIALELDRLGTLCSDPRDSHPQTLRPQVQRSSSQ